MAPLNTGKYLFSPQSLVEVRTKLKLKQIEMAKLIGVPPNTLSRWETGATTPDAESLAVIHSIAIERKLGPPQFFIRRPAVEKKGPARSRLLVIWDFQGFPIPTRDVDAINRYIRKELEQRFPSVSYRLFKAFGLENQAEATEKLQDLGWRVWEDDNDIVPDLMAQSRSDCGQEPKASVYVLLTNSPAFADLLMELQGEGVDAYLGAPPYVGKKLLQSVPPDHHINIPVSSPSSLPDVFS